MKKKCALNALMLVSLGFFAPLLFEIKKRWNTVFVGSGISHAIEFLQCMTRRGKLEMEDLMDNTLGVRIGLAIHHVVKRIYDDTRHASTY